MPPLAELLHLLLYSVLPATAVAALVFALVRGALGKDAARAAAALSLLGGFAYANVLEEQLPWWPETSSWTWTFPALALVTLVEVVATLPRIPLSLAALARLVACGVAAWWLVPPDVRAAWWTVPTFALALFAGWQLLEHRLRDLPAGLGPLLLALIFGGGAALVLLHADTLRFTTAVTILAAGLFGVAAGALLAREDGRGVAGPTVLLPLALLLCHWNANDTKVPGASFFLVGLAPLALLLTYLPPVRTWTDWRRGLAGMALLLIPIVLAVILAAVYEPLRFE